MRELKGAAAVFVVASLAASSALAAPSGKGTSPKAACLAAHESALQLKSDKKPHAAKDEFIACARNECPVVVRKECTDQIAEMDKIAPTITLEALDDKGATDAAVKVTLDGKVVAEKLDGSAIDVEPGDHQFTFERASDGKKLEQKVLVVEGEKDRKITADYQTLLPPKPVATAAPPPQKEIPVVAFVTGGVAIAGLGLFTAFAIAGRSKEGNLSDTCAPHCASASVKSVKTDYAIGDVSLGLGIVGLVATAILVVPALVGPQPAPALAPRPWLPRLKVIR